MAIVRHTALALSATFVAIALGAAPPDAGPGEPAAPKAASAESQAAPKEKKTPGPVDQIRDEGLNRSQVMATLGRLTDVIGARLTGSPALQRANEWTRDQFSAWGLEQARLEPWGPFGRGWSLRRFSAQVVEPQCIPLVAMPEAWSPGLDGPAVLEVAALEAKTIEELARYKGRLKGKAVLVSPERAVRPRFDPPATRLTDSELLALADADPTVPAQEIGTERRVRERRQDEWFEAMLRLLLDEGAALMIEASLGGEAGGLTVTYANVPGGVLVPEGRDRPRVTPWSVDAPRTVPQVVVGKEHYNRLLRMLRHGESLKLAVDFAVEFHDRDTMAYNTLAEIPGDDRKDEVVMLGAHLDSWHAGTGATDNATGVAVCMEAVRILKTVGLRPRRTIRIALWTGEEQGLLGSRAYVAEHFGKDPSEGAASCDKRAAREAFSVYFNLDTGTGKIRGLYLQGNEPARARFRPWLTPLRDLGVETLTLASSGGSDHVPFDAAGLPAFEFAQDLLEYKTRTHHSSLDVYDRAVADDLKQAAVVMAAFIYNAASCDALIPRKPAARKALEALTD